MPPPVSVLYVDDEPGLLEIAQLFLEREGEFAVTTMLSAKEALDSPAICSCNVIVADYQMPEMNGLAFLKEVRRRFGDTPFILFTGRGREEVVIDAINNGVDFYLQKGGDPVAQFAELAHKIRVAVQRKEAEMARHESEEKYRTLFETTGTAMVLIEEDTTLSLVNNEFLLVTGYTRDEVENRKKWTEFVVKEDLDRMLSQHTLRRIHHDRALTQYEFGLVTKSGAIREIHLTIDTLPGTKKSVASLIDITDRKRAEQALQESEAKFRSIVETSPNLIWEIDPRGTFVYVSPSIREIVGYLPGEMIGRSFQDLVPEKEKARSLQLFRDVLATDQPLVSFEVPVVTNTGEQRFFEIRPVVLRDTDNRITGLRGVAIDITGRREAEEKLRESERMARAIFDATFQFTGIVSPEGILLDANRTALDFIGMPREAVINRPFWETPWWDDDNEKRERLIQAVRDAAGGAFVRYEVGFVGAGGSEVLTDFSLKPVSAPDGRVWMLVAEARDITDRVQAERKIRESEAFNREVIEGAKEGIVVYDRDLTIRLWNPFMEGLTGLPASGVVGKKAAELFPFLVRNGVIRLIGEALGGVPQKSADFPFTIPSTGKSGWVRSVYGPLYDADGRITGVIGTIRDITTRIKAEEALKASEEQFRLLFDHMNEGVALHELITAPDGSPEDYRILAVNAAYERHTGLLSSGVIGKTGQEAYGTPEPPYLDVFCRVAVTGTPEIFETWFAPLKKHFRISVYSPGKNQFATVFFDITASKEAEEALRESEESYRSIIENMQEMFYRADMAGNLILVSPAGARMVGYDHPEEMIGKNIADYWIHPKGRKKFIELLKKDGSIQGYPATVRDRYGSVHYLSTNCHLYKDKNGTVLGIEGVAHDITALKEAEEALQAAREKYSKIYREAPDAITLSDLATGEYIEVNEAATRIFGYSREELVGHSASDLGIWLDPSQRDAIISRIRTDGRVERFEVTERRKSGELFPAFVNADSITIGDRECLIAITRDMTREKQAEEAYRRANEKLNLLTNITRHDIRNQLTILSGFMELFARSSRTSPSSEELLRKARKALDSIRDQIDFTRVYQDLGAQAPSWQNVEDAARKAAGELDLSRVRLDLAGMHGVEVFADPMLSKVFFNLFDNALRYGGERMTKITLSLQDPDDSLLIACEDDGVGIGADEKERIFERGYGKNTGLGLFLSREILGITGITIAETGTPGTGARFEIMVPKTAYRVLPS